MDFGVPDGPAWFSQSENVARDFVDWHKQEDGRPRIITLKVMNVPDLAVVTNKQELSDLLEEFGINANAFDSSDLMAMVGSKYDGWIIPDNYGGPGMSDIMILRPQDYLRFVKEHEVAGNPDIVAAFKSPRSGKVFVGETHGDAFAASDVKSVDELTQNEFLEAEGFSAPDGTGFMSREEALEQLGFSCTEDRNPPATPIVLSRDYYHATSEETSGESILKDDLIVPRPGKAGRGLMAPRKDFVYMSPQLYMAAIYALGGVFMGHEYPKDHWRGRGQYGYIFLVHKGDLVDVEPDEDDIGELAVSKIKRGPNGFTAEWNDGLGLLAIKHSSHDRLSRAEFGEAAYQSAIGKKILKYMSPEWKLELMNDSKINIANRGPVGFDAAWRLDKLRAPEIAEDGSNVLEIAERIK